MPLLIILLFPVAEIFVAIAVGEEIGFFNTIALLCGAALVGMGILSITGRSFLAELQIRAMRGEALGNVLLSQALRFMAGVMFLIPGFISDGIAIICLLASLFPSLFAKPLNRNVQKWNSRFVVFTHQSGQAGGFPPGPQSWRQARDVTPEDPRVIDVSPEKPQSQD